jgi:hypothetical protein
MKNIEFFSSLIKDIFQNIGSEPFFLYHKLISFYGKEYYIYFCKFYQSEVNWLCNQRVKYVRSQHDSFKDQFIVFDTKLAWLSEKLSVFRWNIILPRINTHTMNCCLSWNQYQTFFYQNLIFQFCCRPVVMK